MNIYVINLDRDQSRLDHMKSRLGDQNIKFIRVPAINKIEAAQLRVLPEDSKMSPIELACTLSHLKALKMFFDSGEDCGLILEDDVHMAGDLGEFLDRMRIDLQEIAIHKLETHNARVTLSRKSAFAVGGRRAYQLHTNHGGAAAYLVNRPTAQYLLKQGESFKHIIDTELFDPVRGSCTDAKIYQWFPAPFVQDFLFKGETIGFQSNLEGDRADERDGLISDHPEGVKGRLKDVLRPFYTGLFSLALIPQGRQRKDVLFG